jgi:hypothetical protein
VGVDSTERNSPSARAATGRLDGAEPNLGDIAQPEVITAILTALKLPTEAPPIARARHPAEFQSA